MESAQGLYCKHSGEFKGEAQGAYPPPLTESLDDCPLPPPLPPPPLSEGLDLPLQQHYYSGTTLSQIIMFHPLISIFLTLLD